MLFQILGVYLAFLTLAVEGAAQIVTCNPGDSTTLNNVAKLWLRTENFPNPYTGYEGSKKCTIRLMNVANKGYRFYLQQFLLEDNDTLRICDKNGQNCVRKQGDVMSHQRTGAFVEMEGDVTLLVSRDAGSPSSTTHHTGFDIYVEQFNVGTPVGTDCKRTISLDKDNPATFIASPDYPSSMPDGIECQYTISTATKYVRVQFFQFNTDETATTFSVTGTRTDGSTEPVSPKGYATIIGPFAVYFKGSIEITFKTTAKSRFENLFFLILDGYDEDSAASATACIGAGNIDLTSTTSHAISTANYGTSAYPNNMDCWFNVTGVPKGRRLTMAMMYESEACCDVMHMKGVKADPQKDDNRYKGNKGSSLVFPETTHLSLHFTSDGVGPAVGFQGTLSYRDCSCGANTISLNAGESINLTSPGYATSGSTYCPGLLCTWTVNFPLSEGFLRVTPVDIDLRDSSDNDLRISDALKMQRKLTSTEASAIELTNGPVEIVFTSDKENFFASPSLLRRGFKLSLEVVAFSTVHRASSESIALTNDEPTRIAELFSREGTSFFRRVFTPPASTLLNLYILEQPIGAIFGIFAGAGDSMKPHGLTTQNNDSMEFDGPVTIQIYANGPVSFRGIVTSRREVDCFDNGTIGRSFITTIDVNTETSVSINAPTSDVVCQKVVYVRGSNNNPYVATRIQVDPFVVMRLYRGIHYPKSESLIASSPPYPILVFGEYFSIEYGKDSAPTASITIYSFLADNTIEVTSSVDSSGALMSPNYADFGDVPLQSPTPVKYLVSLPNEKLARYEVSFPEYSRDAKITVNLFDGQKLLAAYEVNDRQHGGPYNVSHCAKTLDISYDSKMANDSGFIVKYSVTECSSTTTSHSPTASVITSCVLFLAMLKSNGA